MSRNIILLSDGTGNSAVSPNKSNVWRLYQTLDLGTCDNGMAKQLAFYDDGVGTSGFRPLQVLGGAFGWGLSRNVRQLYENLCRHYEPGDKIFIFGFSRGAFTARVLAHFISICGILDRTKCAPNGGPSMATDAGLREGVKAAYKSYRHWYWNNDNTSPFLKLVSIPFRWVRNKIPGFAVLTAADFKAQCSIGGGADRSASGDQAKDSTIEFVGVWDTVDAVGLPIDELSEFLDKVIYPYKFPDQDFPSDIARGRHALALDDERQTFHPLLWNEHPDKLKHPERLKQVWFAGMHSNVGGSYPEDNLALLALNWMIGEASRKEEGTPLLFQPNAVATIRAQAQHLGKLYNSRRGAGMFYRYKPRDVAALCGHGGKDDPDTRVYVETPRVHHSVVDRIRDQRVGYSTLALRGPLQLVDESGALIDPADSDSPYFEKPEHVASRAHYLERAQNYVIWNRVCYFAMLAVVAGLILLPHYIPPIPGLVLETTLSKAIGFIFGMFSAVTPTFLSTWIDGWTQSPKWFLFLVGMFGLLFWLGGRISAVIQDATETGWAHFKHSAPPDDANGPGWLEVLAAQWRTWKASIGDWRPVKQWVLPALFFLVVGSVVAAAAYRILVHYPQLRAGTCTALLATVETEMKKPVTQLAKLEPGAERAIPYDAAHPCQETGVELEAGKKYQVKVASFPGWSDGGVPAGFDGLKSFWAKFDLAFIVGTVFRRRLRYPWFMLTGEIGRDTGVVFPIREREFTFQAPASGTLYLYVNDAINTAGGALRLIGFTGEASDLAAFYRNNSGSAEITIRLVE